MRPGFLKINSAGRILEVGRLSESKLKIRSKDILREKVIIPGLVDAHTHLVFAGDRSAEWGQRLQGTTYQEIAKRGGGILRTLHATRAATEAQLFELAKSRLKIFLSHGVTTLEAKSGYGLSLSSEIKILKVIQRLKRQSAQRIFSTFMGAHAVPNGFKSSTYIDYLISDLLPIAAKLADFQDVFCEDGYFNEKESIRLLQAGRKLGLIPRVHAHEFGRSGGVRVATKVKALSADHLMAMNEGDMKALKKAKVTPVLLPGTSFFLGAKRFAPAKKMWAMGLKPAIATDFNPGTNPTMNMPLCGTLAAIHYGLSLDQVLTAQTLHGAYSLGRSDFGSLEKGQWADFVSLDAKHFEELYYSYGNSLVKSVVICGKKVR